MKIACEELISPSMSGCSALVERRDENVANAAVYKPHLASRPRDADMRSLRVYVVTAR